MNLTFSAFILLVLILPGYAFRQGFKYFQGENVDPTTLGPEAAKSIILAGVLHSLWFYFITPLVGYSVDLDFVLKLLTYKNELQFYETHNLLTQPFLPIEIYFLSLLAFSFGLGRLVQLGLYKLGKRNPRFNFHWNSKWFVRLFNFSEYEKDPDFTKVTFVMDLKDASYLYTGVLDEIFLDKSGDLDKIFILFPHRKKLTSGQERTNPSFYEIRSDKFAVSYNQIRDLAVSHYKLDTPTEGG